MSGLGFPSLGSPASIPQQAGISHERNVNLLPPSDGKVSLGMGFPKKKPGGTVGCWHQTITVTPPLLLHPDVYSQSNPAVVRIELENLCMIKVSL